MTFCTGRTYTESVPRNLPTDNGTTLTHIDPNEPIVLTQASISGYKVHISHQPIQLGLAVRYTATQDRVPQLQ